MTLYEWTERWMEDEIDAYLDAAEELGHLPMFTLMLTAGLRQRELLTLKWSDFDETRGVLTVSEGRSLVKGRLVEYSGGTHEVTLTPETAALLHQEHAKHPSAELMFIHPGTRKPYLPTMVRLLHQKILDKAGLEPCRFEDLRHTAAVRMLNKEGSVKAMSAQLGHSSPVMTKLLYADFLPVKKESAGKINVYVENGEEKACCHRAYPKSWRLPPLEPIASNRQTISSIRLKQSPSSRLSSSSILRISVKAL